MSQFSCICYLDAILFLCLMASPSEEVAVHNVTLLSNVGRRGYNNIDDANGWGGNNSISEQPQFKETRQKFVRREHLNASPWLAKHKSVGNRIAVDVRGREGNHTFGSRSESNYKSGAGYSSRIDVRDVQSYSHDIEKQSYLILDPIKWISGLESYEKHGAKYAQAWAAASFRNDAFERKARLLNKGPLTITSIGGSSSSLVNSYLHTMADRLQRRKIEVRIFNPSQGDTGSVWGGLMLQCLVPKETDIIIWEYITNDRMPLLTPRDAAEYHKKAFELFLRRVLAFNSDAIIGLVGLWQPDAKFCWPCIGDSDHFNELLEVVARYKNVALFGIDVNKFAQELGLSRDFIFVDRHHPTHQAHALIGEALFTHTLLPSESYGGPLISLSENSFLIEPLNAVSLTSAEIASPLLAAIWDTRNEVQSLLYSKPHFGGQAVFAFGGLPKDFGKSDANRVDHKIMVQIPTCDTGSITYTVPSRRSRIHFIGFGVAQSGSFDSAEPPDFGTFIQVRLNGQLCRSVTYHQLHDEMHASLLIREGLLEPRAFFAARDTAFHLPSVASVCQSIARFFVTSVVFI